MSYSAMQIESLEGRQMFAFSIPGFNFDIPNIPANIDIPGINLPGTTTDKSVAESLAANRKKYGVPGMIAATIKDGQVDEIASAGVRKAGESDRIRWGDQFFMASVTKSMTSMLAARLVDRGYIRWDTKIVDVFPRYVGKIKAQYLNVTLEQLLAHRSGLPTDLSPELTIQTAIAEGTPLQIRGNHLRLILRQAPVGAVGEYSYSNAGYIVAGTMLEAVMRESYENMMQRLIFTPLGMTSAGFGWPGSGEVVDQPRGHNAAGEPQSPDSITRFSAAYNPAGGAHTNILDWAKYVQVQFGLMPKRFLTSDSFLKLRTPYNGPGTSYGMGWVVTNVGPVSLLQHDGHEGNWYASMVVNVKAKTAILVAGNRGGPAGASAVQGTVSDLYSRLKIGL